MAIRRCSQFLLLIALVMLAGASSARAQTCKAPPGTAAIDEYCETVPSATGNSDSGATRSQTRVPIARTTVRALAQSGAEGKALNRVLGQSGTTRKKARSRSQPKAPLTRSATKPAEAAAPSSNPLSA